MLIVVKLWLMVYYGFIRVAIYIYNEAINYRHLIAEIYFIVTEQKFICTLQK